MAVQSEPPWPLTVFSPPLRLTLSRPMCASARSGPTETVRLAKSKREE